MNMRKRRARKRWKSNEENDAFTRTITPNNRDKDTYIVEGRKTPSQQQRVPHYWRRLNEVFNIE